MNTLDNNTNLILKQAIFLSEKMGWSIIPISKDKKPLVEWKVYQTEKASREHLERWFSNPQVNIGVVTGKISNLFIVDIDPRHGGSDTDFQNVKTVKSKTGGGGFHIFFQYEEGFQNHANIKPGIDTRGEGGYAILPLSIHESGDRYEWINSPEDTGLAPIPDFVKEWVKSQQNDWTNANGKVESLLNGVAEGHRNDSAASVVGKLLNKFEKSEWESQVWPLFDGWNSKNNPPLPTTELRSVYESIAARERNKNGGTETPQDNKPKLISTDLTYSEVEVKVKDMLPNSQTALKLVLAVSVSCYFQNPVMIWLLLVGVPSSGKTDMVRLVKDADITYYLDNLTQNAFISGERSSKSNKVHDLLPLLDKKCLIIKDWTSIFSLDEKMTKKLLGDLVGIYDKEFTKFSSRRGNITYSSAFSQLGCITPATLNKHTQYMNMVGPRFLCFTMPLTTFDAEDKSYQSIFSGNDRSLVEKEARLYVSSYLNQLIKQTPAIKPFSQEVQHYLKMAAKLMSNCRGIVLLQSATFKNDEGEDIRYYEVLDVQIEEPWRAVQQLASLAKYLAFVTDKDEVGVEELEIIKEVVISSMPADRSQALRVIKEHGGVITAKELSDLSEKSTKTSRRLLDELSALKALEKIKGSGNVAADYKIMDQFKDFLLLDPTEFVSHNYRWTETPHSFNPDTPIDQLTPDEQLSLVTSIFGEGTKWSG